MQSRSENVSLAEHRDDLIRKYWAGDMARKVYLVRRQRKAILENCRRIAVVGASSDPESESFTAIEKLLGLGLEVIPVFPGRESFLGLRCFARLSDIPGQIDIVQVYPGPGVDLVALAREAVAKQVVTFWIEGKVAASEEVENILADGRVQLVEYESLVSEYVKHAPFAPGPSLRARKERKMTRVRERMTRNPATVRPDDSLKDAAWKMEKGRFRHLPVVDDTGKLIGMLSDRDIRLIRPSLAFVSKEDAMVQLWSITVQQAAVFDPIKVRPETTLKEAADLMLRWQVGGLPVVDEQDKVVGIITYTDILREFVGREESV
ncbi:MAG TPA: CBS domain-containing protein [candidate division Zixibacteria bacterium]|nr:CBS domain-containing protein [candidate division Zixibacteria bacterium]